MKVTRKAPQELEAIQWDGTAETFELIKNQLALQYHYDSWLTRIEDGTITYEANNEEYDTFTIKLWEYIVFDNFWPIAIEPEKFFMQYNFMQYNLLPETPVVLSK